MAEKGRLRRLFAGGNTSQGFYSLFHHILPQEDAARIFVVKGGPGVGKSTFMAKTADTLIDMGFDVDVFVPSLEELCKHPAFVEVSHVAAGLSTITVANAGVVAEAAVLFADSLPAASYADTWYE
jgi:Mrp family chromosome partitioning ATPase